MRKWLLTSGILAGLVSVATGCKSLTSRKHDNPVLQPPPRRVTMDDSATEQALAERGPGKRAGSTAADGTIRPASQQAGTAADDTDVFNARVLARVNGAPVFAGEVLERYGDYLNKARQQLPEEQFLELREAIIRRDLRAHIERRLLVERMKSGMKAEQLKGLEQHIDRAFETEVDRLKKELKVSTRTELELALNDRNTTLAAVRDSFATQRLAMEYLQMKIERPPEPTRPEIVAYYQEHPKEFAIPARVRWQQISVSYGPKQTRTEAKARLEEARQALTRGKAFEAVAKEFSDGPTAADGGQWDWTQVGSLADSKLEEQLFALPVGKLSEPIDSRNAIHLVRVQERQAAGRKPIADVQEEIAQKLALDRRRELPKQFVEKLLAEAVIETEYDLTPQATGKP